MRISRLFVIKAKQFVWYFPFVHAFRAQNCKSFRALNRTRLLLCLRTDTINKWLGLNLFFCNRFRGDSFFVFWISFVPILFCVCIDIGNCGNVFLSLDFCVRGMFTNCVCRVACRILSMDNPNKNLILAQPQSFILSPRNNSTIRLQIPLLSVQNREFLYGFLYWKWVVSESFTRLACLV
jgi:hypothetical protein